MFLAYRCPVFSSPLELRTNLLFSWSGVKIPASIKIILLIVTRQNKSFNIVMPYGDCSSVYVTLLLMHSYFLLCRKSILKTLMSNKKKSNFIFVIPEKLSPTKKLSSTNTFMDWFVFYFIGTDLWLEGK